MPGTAPQRRTDLRQLARIALLLLVLFATGVQQWAVRTHWHAPGGVPETTGVVVAQAIALPAGESGEGTRAHDCLWCQVAAHAAGIAPPAPDWQAAQPASILFPLAAAASAAPHSASPSWAWQSRGPPTV